MRLLDKFLIAVFWTIVALSPVACISANEKTRVWVKDKAEKGCYIDSYAGKQATPVWKCPNDPSAYLQP